MSDPTRFVLDSYALLMYFKDEPGADEIEHVLREGKTTGRTLFMNEINLGEVFYCLGKRFSLRVADEKLAIIRALNITWVVPDSSMILNAARLKARFAISYADGFCAATCVRVGGQLMTGDPEFKALEQEIDIYWLPQNKNT